MASQRATFYTINLTTFEASQRIEPSADLGHGFAPVSGQTGLSVAALSRYDAIIMQASPFGERLKEEYESRRARNTRYSLRAFAAFLGADHSSLSQIFRNTRHVPARQLRSWAKKLDMLPEEIALYVAAEHVPDAPGTRRLEQLRHWTAEGLAIAASPIHWKLLSLVRSHDFRFDCRWIAKKTGHSLDEVNIALSRLLRLGLIQISSTGEWKDLTGPSLLKPEVFRRLALVRIRERAAEDGIRLNGH